MSLKRLSLLLVMFFFALSLGWLTTPAEAAGPWKAQIVDAETKQPLEGVVVLAVWFKYTASVGGWASQRYYTSEEVVTGQDGRFVIQARWTFTLLPFITTIQGPEFLIFRPGYGRWRIGEVEEWRVLDREERKARYERAWSEPIEGKGIVIELPPLKTRKERLDSVSHAEPSGVIPASRMSRYLEAIDQERVFLGLQPLRRSE